MANFSLAEVCAATGGSIGKSGDYQFKGVCTDTRSVQAGDLFIALRGERFDGHDFISQAVEKGAAGVVVDRLDELYTGDAAVVVVSNTLHALQNLATYHRRRFRIPVVAVTGSNGKTTTKDLTAAVLASRLPVLKTQANFNNEIGLPLTLLNLTKDHRAAVVEMGMRGLGEIAELARIAEPTAAIVTNVGETHIELLGSLENIAIAKSELVEAIDATGFVVLNADNPYVQAMSKKAKGKVLLYGLESPCDVQACEIRTEGFSTMFVCRIFGAEFPIKLPAIGKHNVYNALAAIATAWQLGLSPADITSGLQAFMPSSMRQHIEQIGSYVVINDTYNASPLSMASALDTLEQVAEGRKVAVLGDMLELGNIAVDAHHRLGKMVAESGVSVVITVGDLAQSIAETARECGVPEAVACGDHEQAWRELSARLKSGDTILVKGSRGMRMEQIIKMFA